MMTCAHCNADFREYVIGDCPEEAKTCDCPWHEHVRACVMRKALENAADDGHHAMCETMRLYRGCTCHQAATLKALGWACPACDGEGALLSGDRVRMHCAACDASGRAAPERTATGSHTCVTSANRSVRITAMTPSRPLTDPMADRIATMEREVARLREALEQATAKCATCSGTGVIHFGCPLCDVDSLPPVCQDFDDEPCPDEACGIARAALATATAKGLIAALSARDSGTQQDGRDGDK